MFEFDFHSVADCLLIVNFEILLGFEQLNILNLYDHVLNLALGLILFDL